MQDVASAIDIANGAAKDVHVRFLTPGNRNEMDLGHDPLASSRMQTDELLLGISRASSQLQPLN